MSAGIGGDARPVPEPGRQVAACQRFLDSASYLGDEDAPAVAALLALAEQIDAEPFQAATFSQYGLTYRSLLKRKPTGPG